MTNPDEALQRERELRESAETAAMLAQADLAAERLAVADLERLTARLFTSTGLQSLLNQVLTATISLQHADFGNVRLYNETTRAVEIAAHYGFRQDFLDVLRECRGETSVCGRALLRGRRVVVEDVRSDPGFAAHLATAAAAGFRAVQSTPLFTRSGAPLGVISTHFREPHCPTERQLRFTDLYCRIAAEIIERHRTDEALRISEERFRRYFDLGLIGMAITSVERQRAKDDVHKLQAQLARVTHATTLEEIAASIAHEISQPLAAVITNGHACMRWLQRPIPDLREAAEASARVVRDAGRASEVITRIRAFLRQEALQVTPTDVKEVISEVISIVQDEMSEQCVSLHMEADVGLPAAAADRIQLQQVIHNLVRNSLDAMLPVVDRVRTLRIEMHRHAADALLIAVCDSGVGLVPEQREHIFDAFHTSKPHGMGMGLAISRSIVEAHGGRLWATPNDRYGETFHFTLPIASA